MDRQSRGQLPDSRAPCARRRTEELVASLADTISLTPFGVEIRYPGDLPELPPKEERTVFNFAKSTFA